MTPSCDGRTFKTAASRNSDRRPVKKYDYRGQDLALPEMDRCSLPRDPSKSNGPEPPGPALTLARAGGLTRKRDGFHGLPVMRRGTLSASLRTGAGASIGCRFSTASRRARSAVVPIALASDKTASCRASKRANAMANVKPTIKASRPMTAPSRVETFSSP